MLTDLGVGFGGFRLRYDGVRAAARRVSASFGQPVRPRIGFTSLSQGVVDTLAARSIEVGPLITQFGWQFEKQFYSKGGGLAAVNEWVVPVGGLEQDVALPSVSWIVGLRTREGAEFGIGPNITPAGTAIVLAAGVTFKAGALNLPVDVAVVPAKSGGRVSMLAGFNFRRR